MRVCSCSIVTAFTQQDLPYQATVLMVVTEMNEVLVGMWALEL